MISEERLKELIEKKQSVYCIFKNINKVCEVNSKQFIVIDSEIYPSYDFFHSGKLDKFQDFSNYYETKEEAEFVLKYHCSKTIKFEPPTFEEFMKIDKEWREWGFSDGCYYIIHNQLLNCIFVGEPDYGNKKFYFKNEKEMEQAYYQAVEYAKKLFLGE